MLSPGNIAVVYWRHRATSNLCRVIMGTLSISLNREIEWGRAENCSLPFFFHHTQWVNATLMKNLFEKPLVFIFQCVNTLSSGQRSAALKQFGKPGWSANCGLSLFMVRAQRLLGFMCGWGWISGRLLLGWEPPEQRVHRGLPLPLASLWPSPGVFLHQAPRDQAAAQRRIAAEYS